jgi:hypothetical protein
MIRVLCPSGRFWLPRRNFHCWVNAPPSNRHAQIMRLKSPLPIRFFMYATRLGLTPSR